MLRLSTSATEGSTYVVTATFADEDGAAVTPTSVVTWKTMTTNGVQIATDTVAAGASVDIVLKGTDLSVGDSAGVSKVIVLKVSTTYTSSRGTDLPLVELVEIPITNALDAP